MNFSKIFRLDNKNVVITGGAGLLGEMFSEGFASQGANVVVLDINIDKAIDVSKNIQKKYDIKSIAMTCDVTNPNQIDKVLNEIYMSFGNIDILVNNAASKSKSMSDFFDSYEEYKQEEWNSIMEQNLTSMFLMSQKVGKGMIERKVNGSIIQISSIYGNLGTDQRIYEGSFYLGTKINTPAIYSVTKAGVIGLTRYLASYWAKDQIRVNTVSPGGVYSGQNQTFIDNYSNKVPMNRMANKEEIVGGVLFLASDAATYITGQNLLIDGGLSCW